MQGIGVWHGGRDGRLFFDKEGLIEAALRFRETAHVVFDPQSRQMGVGLGGVFSSAAEGGLPVLGVLAGIYPEWLGGRRFCEAHGVRFPYVVGEMARGIATAHMVIEAGRSGFLGFFGAAGMDAAEVEKNLERIESALGDVPWGCNLIFAPGPMEEATTEALLRCRVKNISCSAYLAITPSVVRLAVSGIKADAQGGIHRPRRLFAKISRPEVARPFLSPAPQAILQELLRRGQITQEEAQLAARVPLAEDITMEADSGGHTDNQVLTAMFGVIARLRDDMIRTHGYACPIRLGAAGGIGTPEAVAAAFALGADYVLTGSVNESAIESGIAPDAREMLAQAAATDVAMAPAADMFEIGAKVQVLKKGTLFAVRANQLYDLYLRYPSIEDIPPETKKRLEAQIFQAPLEKIWEETRDFFISRAPREIERAERDPKFKMALLFRWYLGQSSRWPMVGQKDRAMDYQIWCGPAMGAFNAWVKGGFLEPVANRTVAQIGKNLLEGACVAVRAQQLASHGVPMPKEAFAFRPRPLQ